MEKVRMEKRVPHGAKALSKHELGATRMFFFFFLFILACDLLDHGGVLVNHFFPSAVGGLSDSNPPWPFPPLPCLHWELNPGSRG